MGVTPAFATLDTQAAWFLALVRKCCYSEYTAITLSFPICTLIQTLMSASPTMEVASTTAITQMEVTHAPALMATNSIVMDTHVKVVHVKKILTETLVISLHNVGISS